MNVSLGDLLQIIGDKEVQIAQLKAEIERLKAAHDAAMKVVTSAPTDTP